MPARNIHYDQVVQALRTDGWTVTDDPYRLTYGGSHLYVDLGAERAIIAAERGPDRITVEVQSFIQRSDIRALQEAIGQYQFYKTLMHVVDPERRLYMAVSRRVDEEVLSERIGSLMIRELEIKVMVFDHIQQRVIRWIE